jgi:hypothetical protein
MKTYEGNVDYSDLWDNDISEVRGYGPCTPSYCSCACPRNDCNCKSNERFVKLFMPCPAVRKEGNSVIRCPGGGKAPTNWVHATDSNYTWISNQARIRCERTNCSATDEMRNWSFRCSEHDFHKGEFLKTTSESWIDVVTTAARVLGDDNLVIELLIYLKSNKWQI